MSRGVSRVTLSSAARRRVRCRRVAVKWAQFQAIEILELVSPSETQANRLEIQYVAKIVEAPQLLSGMRGVADPTADAPLVISLEELLQFQSKVKVQEEMQTFEAQVVEKQWNMNETLDAEKIVGVPQRLIKEQAVEAPEASVQDDATQVHTLQNMLRVEVQGVEEQSNTPEIQNAQMYVEVPQKLVKKETVEVPEACAHEVQQVAHPDVEVAVTAEVEREFLALVRPSIEALLQERQAQGDVQGTMHREEAVIAEVERLILDQSRSTIAAMVRQRLDADSIQAHQEERMGDVPETQDRAVQPDDEEQVNRQKIQYEAEIAELTPFPYSNEEDGEVSREDDIVFLIGVKRNKMKMKRYMFKGKAVSADHAEKPSSVPNAEFANFEKISDQADAVIEWVKAAERSFRQIEIENRHIQDKMLRRYQNSEDKRSMVDEGRYLYVDLLCCAKQFLISRGINISLILNAASVKIDNLQDVKAATMDFMYEVCDADERL